jgi:hypothetical protein
MHRYQKYQHPIGFVGNPNQQIISFRKLHSYACAWMVDGVRSMGRVRVEHLDPRIQMVSFHEDRHRRRCCIWYCTLQRGMDLSIDMNEIADLFAWYVRDTVLVQ